MQCNKFVNAPALRKFNKKAVLSQGNRAMQHIFPTSNDSLIVICFGLRKVKAVIAPAVICLTKADWMWN